MFNLKINMCSFDRILRFILGASLVIISKPILDLVPGFLLSYFCLIFGLVNIASSAFSWCVVYSMLGINSRNKKGDNN